MTLVCVLEARDTEEEEGSVVGVPVRLGQAVDQRQRLARRGGCV